MMNGVAASIWVEFFMPSAEAMFFDDGSNNSHGFLYMSANGGGEEGYTDLRALTQAQNIFFHGQTHVVNDIYFIAAEVSVTVLYENDSTERLYDWNVAEENYTIPCAVAVAEYSGYTPECYIIDELESTHKMYITTIVDGEFIIVEQLGPPLYIGTLES